MLKDIASIEFYDEESGSEAFASIRKYQDKIALSLSVEASGDLDTLMRKEKAKEIADALYKAIGESDL